MNLELDQHFLLNKKILNLTIKESDIKKEDIIFEIGAGEGALTKQLIKTSAKKIICVEKDLKLNKELSKNKAENLEIIFEDAIKKIDKHLFSKLIANIPYSITEPLYIKMLELEVKFAILLQGKKFYDLVYNNNSKWHYFINSFYDIKLLCEVNGDSFEPSTKTKSVLIKLTQKKKFSKKDLFFQNLFKKQKRNTKNALLFALVDTYKIPKKDVSREIENMIFPNKKLESLSNKEFLEIITALKQQNFSL